MRVIAVVLCLCVALGAMAPAQRATAAELPDQENTVSTTVVQPMQLLLNNQYWVQSFEAGMTGELTSVQFGIGSNVAANLTMEIIELAVVGSAIPWEALATSTVAVAAGGCDPSNPVEFSFDVPAEIVAEQSYLIVIYGNAGTTHVCGSESDAYARGSGGFGFPDGPATSDPPYDPDPDALVFFISEGLDYVFRTFVDPNNAWLIDNLAVQVRDTPITSPKAAGESIRRSMSTMVAIAEASEAYGSDATACLMLSRFELEVRSQVSKRRISRADGAELIEQSSLIRSEIGCGIAR